MERTVSERRAIRLIVFFTFLVFLSSGSIAGGGGGMTGGALEVTQLANNAELVASYAKEAEAAMNTLQTAVATLENLRQLPNSVVSQISGPQLRKLQQMAEVYLRLKSIHERTTNLSASMRRVSEMSNVLKLTPSEVLQAKVDAANAYGGFYREQLTMEADNLQQLEKEVKEFNDSQNFTEIKSSVSGLQYLANQNVALYNMLGNLNRTLAVSNQIAAAKGTHEIDQEKLHRANAEALDRKRQEALSAFVSNMRAAGN